MTDISKAIKSLDPSAQVSVNADDIDQITWHDGNPNNITEEQIRAKQAELQIEYDAQAYARNREPEYPPIGDQLDALFHAGVFPDDMAAVLQAVKDKYPKV
jgi:hypothetical protein|tara:strand:- start:50 stop:352 length:303 start_codon:yes stop_codon:yes gene_type:complete